MYPPQTPQAPPPETITENTTVTIYGTGTPYDGTTGTVRTVNENLIHDASGRIVSGLTWVTVTTHDGTRLDLPRHQVAPGPAPQTGIHHPYPLGTQIKVIDAGIRDYGDTGNIVNAVESAFDGHMYSCKMAPDGTFRTYRDTQIAVVAPTGTPPGTAYQDRLVEAIHADAVGGTLNPAMRSTIDAIHAAFTALGWTPPNTPGTPVTYTPPPLPDRGTP